MEEKASSVPMETAERRGGGRGMILSKRGGIKLYCNLIGHVFCDVTGMECK